MTAVPAGPQAASAAACTAALLFRALLMWGGNRKQLCFKTWKHWVALKQGRRQSVRLAMQHWQHLLLGQAFDGWQQQIQRTKVCTICTSLLDQVRSLPCLVCLAEGVQLPVQQVNLKYVA
jgi:hypothetical protein